MIRQVLLLIVLALVTAGPSGAVSVSVDVTPRDLDAGDSATLTVTVDGVQNAAPPDLGNIDGFEVSYVGPSTQVSVVNGQVTALVQHRFALLAQRPGRFTLGPFTIAYAGGSATTGTVAVEVRAPTAGPRPGSTPGGQGSSPDQQAVRLELAAPKQEVYVNEPLAVDVTLYVGPVRVTDVQYPTLPDSGLAIEKFTEPSQRQQVIDGTTYQVVRFRTTVVPLRAGTQTLGPAVMRMSLLQRRRGRGQNDPFFGGFFDDSFFSEKRAIELRSNDVPMTVLPLPDIQRPADFAGAVGQFSLTVTAAPAEVTAGDPVTVRMTVSGSGYLGEAVPRFVDTTGFKAYDPTTTASDAAAARASKAIEQVLVPTAPSVRAVPAARFSFFDPATRQYRTVDSQPIALIVRPPAGVATPQVLTGAPGAPPRAAETLGRDIVYIKDAPGDLRAAGALGSDAWLLLWLPVPVALFATAAYYDRRRRLLHGDPRYARFSRAGRDARAGLDAAAAAAAAQNRTVFYDTVFRTVQSYLAAKLELPPGVIDVEVIAGRGVDAATVDLVRSLFGACEQARFAPHADAADLQQLLATAQEIVRRLERTRSYGARLAAGAAAVATLGLAVGGSAGAATPETTTPKTIFYEGNSAYRAGDFAGAIAAYEHVAGGGHGSSALYFNLGNAYFKKGERGRAILNYERARELSPRDPDVLANLAYAESVAGLEPCALPVWEQMVFPLARRVTRAGLLWAALGAYTASVLVLALRRLLPARPVWLAWCAGALGALALWVGATAAYREATERGAAAVVVAGGETPVRFEPAATGTVHFSAHEGTLLRIAGERDGWVQVTRCDGRRGWMEGSAVAPLWGS